MAGRYDDVPVATTTVPDGSGGTRTVRHLRRRRPPAPAAPPGGSLPSGTATLPGHPGAVAPPLALHRVGDDDRLDLVAYRYLGDPLAAWRLADANNALNPAELTANPGDIVVVPTPEAG